ncbi:Uncharacterized protein TCM_028433 [Theobroma cacao]|uniref:Uncharacterized protein n=1 Tax=Theobroma cacao TaxID=3641 RepID=A0A061GHR6_THECC|nr:Uncharacterized protein TCM_028433 [Theobroma cacao]
MALAAADIALAGHGRCRPKVINIGCLKVSNDCDVPLCYLLFLKCQALTLCIKA